ncbi:hypothetical protein Q5741_08380 [Paenibacillus sp. JX-17]|uniref:Uncharacterized protein n=1 Tax=Paenibacillus lacisoli TaxID=3064525 RepID=A0ABT9CEP7_9BACL|nr:hypothetical protein [Paenibacillus sp. JX-17]MDO7906432.1 hypothetical protein [Paenibacillus sp. JX-17]
MKVTLIFILLFTLMLGINYILDLVFGVSSPLKFFDINHYVMRPSEEIGLTAFLLVIIVQVTSRHIKKALQAVYHAWLRLITPPSSLPSSAQQTGDQQQKRE